MYFLSATFYVSISTFQKLIY